MANRIKERRIFKGYTQAELAEKLGLQKSAIAKYENGRVKNIKQSTLAAMANILECSPSYLMGWSERSNIAFETTEDDTRYTRIRKMLSNGEEVSPDDLEYFRTETAATIKKVPDVFKRYADELEEIHLQAMVDDYKLLNADGKVEARKRVEELTYIPRYTAASGNITPVVPAEPLVNAAHTRTDIDVTKEMKQHNDDIMDDSTNWE